MGRHRTLAPFMRINLTQSLTSKKIANAETITTENIDGKQVNLESQRRSEVLISAAKLGFVHLNRTRPTDALCFLQVDT